MIATVDELIRPQEDRSPNLGSTVSRIQPAVEPLLQGQYGDKELLVQQAVRANIFASVKALQEGSEILRDLVTKKQLLIVGAEYSLATGLVEFFEDA